MKKTWLVIATVGLTLATLAGACNDDGGDEGDGGDGGEAVSLEEYFAAVQEADDAFATGTDELGTEFDALSSDQVSEAADLLAEQVSLLSDFADDLDEIEAPEEVVEIHDETVESLRAYADVFGPAIDEFREASTIDEGFAAFAEFDQSTLDTAQANCTELSQIAADNDIEVSLSCGVGEAA